MSDGEGGAPAPDTDLGRMFEDVRDGLSREQKEIPSKYFYDDRGSQLFEEITRLPEYYPTRTERKLLRSRVTEWVRELRPVALVELGAGSASKTRILLDAMVDEGSGELYVPVDVSAAFLDRVAEELDAEYEGLAIEPEVADVTRPLELTHELPSPTLFVFLGSTIGNFAEAEAVRLLGRVRDEMGPDDAFLLGVDLKPGPRKPAALLEAAYDDAGGVTAAFNRNVLAVLNRELGTDFDPEAFRHRAFYDDGEARIEMHLVAEDRQVVRLPGAGTFTFRDGESVRTEISCKYDRPTVERLFEAAGLRLRAWCEDDDGLYAMALAALPE